MFGLSRLYQGHGGGQGESLFPKKDAVEINQFGPISLLTVEVKIFFSVVARRLTSYLVKNNLIDSSVQNAGIPSFSGCLEHTLV